MADTAPTKTTLTIINGAASDTATITTEPNGNVIAQWASGRRDVNPYTTLNRVVGDYTERCMLAGYSVIETLG